MPWTQDGNYLDFLTKDLSDPEIAKKAAEIPYPLIVKSDVACGDPLTHAFTMITKQPENWAKMKEEILKTLKGHRFIIQEFVKDKNNVVLKCRSLFDSFGLGVHEGIYEISLTSACGEFFERPANMKSVTNKTFLSSDHMEDAKAF